MWPLLSDSWGIIDPLLSSCPGTCVIGYLFPLNDYVHTLYMYVFMYVCMYVLDLSGRLAPLCQPLRLKKSDFNSRRITALYDNLTRRIDSRDKDADSDSEPRGLIAEISFFLVVFSHINKHTWHDLSGRATGSRSETVGSATGVAGHTYYHFRPHTTGQGSVGVFFLLKKFFLYMYVCMSGGNSPMDFFPRALFR